MLSNFFAVLCVLCLIAILYFLVGIAKPGLRFVGTRSRATIFALLSFVAFITFAGFGAATQTPAQRRATEEQRAAREEQRAAQKVEQAQKAEAVATAPREGETLVTAQGYDERWPFTVPNGFLSCVDKGRNAGSVLFRTGDTVYGLNGTAKGKGYPAPTPILKTQSLGTVKPVARLSEDQRRRIFASIVACEDANPDDRTASRACKAKLQQAEGLAAEELKIIGYEGATQSWPPLKPTYMDTQPLITAGRARCEAN